MAFITTWEARCYLQGIPDEVPAKVAKAMRAPSYKAIALAILRNDHNLHALGFAEKDSVLVQGLLQQKARSRSLQRELF